MRKACGSGSGIRGTLLVLLGWVLFVVPEDIDAEVFSASADVACATFAKYDR
jgi:hypothetical protein